MGGRTCKPYLQGRRAGNIYTLACVHTHKNLSGQLTSCTSRRRWDGKRHQNSCLPGKYHRCVWMCHTAETRERKVYMKYAILYLDSLIAVIYWCLFISFACGNRFNWHQMCTPPVFMRIPWKEEQRKDSHKPSRIRQIKNSLVVSSLRYGQHDPMSRSRRETDARTSPAFILNHHYEVMWHDTREDQIENIHKQKLWALSHQPCLVRTFRLLSLVLTKIPGVKSARDHGPN